MSTSWHFRPIELGAHGVAVWVGRRVAGFDQALLDDPARAGLLDDEDLIRCRMLPSPAARERLLAGRWLLRSALSALMGQPLKEWRIDTDPRGRPRLSTAHPGALPQFSLAHAPGLVLCAVSRTHAVGIDVERADPRVDFRPLARLVCGPMERQGLPGLPRPRHNHRFLRLWTLKEAQAKACGRGLADCSLTKFEFELHRRRVVSSSVPPPASGWTWRQFGIGNRYIAALAVGPGHDLAPHDDAVPAHRDGWNDPASGAGP